MLFSDLLYEPAANDHLFLNQDYIYNEHGIIVGKYNFSDILENIKVSINLISIYPEHRRKGYFSRFMNVICKTADEHQIELELIPMPTSIKDSPANEVTIGMLKTIYSGYGFTPEYEEMEISIFCRKPLPRYLSNATLVAG